MSESEKVGGAERWNLVESLARRLAVTFASPDQLDLADRSSRDDFSDLSKPQQQQLREMVELALRDGLLADASPGEWRATRFRDGNTAQLVVAIPLTLHFVAKWDTSEKLLREAAWLQSVATRADLPEHVRRMLPRVYAIRRGEETHCYLMEEIRDPYCNLARALNVEIDNPPFCRSLISGALDSLFRAYDATLSDESHPLLPDVGGLYVDRIRVRLMADEVDEELRTLRESRLVVGRDEVTLPPCGEMLDTLDQLWPRLQSLLTPRFVTMVFGDPHPGNIFIRADHTGVRGVKVIDPKEWGEGDYLFDLAKFLHYLEVTWLVEDRPPPVVELVQHANAIHIQYSLQPPNWLAHGREDILARIPTLLQVWSVRHPGGDAPDPHWRMRLDLGMASNLLGVAGSRYLRSAKGGGTYARRVIFAEGASALHQFLLKAKELLR